MSVRVRMPGQLRTLYPGTPQWLELDAATLGELLQALNSRMPHLLGHLIDESGQIRPWVNIFVGGEDVRLGQGLATPLPPGGEVLIIPSIVGG